MSPESPEPQSIDFTNTPLRVDQPVAFIEGDQDRRDESRLYGGTIKLIGEGQLVVQSGKRLFIVNGREESRSMVYRYWKVIVLGPEHQEQ